MPYPIEEAQENLRKSAQRFRLAVIMITLLLSIFIAVNVYIVGKQVRQQSDFIINYLRCIGQTPQAERGPQDTNFCFDKYAPREEK